MFRKSHYIISASAVLTAACIITAVHAAIVKTNLTGLLSGIAPVPAGSQEAFKKCIKKINGELKVNPDIENFGKKLEEMIKENAVPAGMDKMPGGKGPGNMPSEDQIDKMSDAEKMAFAMKMQGQMMMPSQPRDPKVYGECINLNNDLAALAGDQAMMQKLGDIEKRYSAEYEKIDLETDDRIDKCPVISTGESSAPDFKCVKSTKLAAADRRIAVSNKQLSELKSVFAWHAARVKPLAVRGDKLLAETKYGEASDDQTKTLLNQMQGLILQQIMQIQTYTQEAYLDAAGRILDRMKVEEMTE